MVRCAIIDLATNIVVNVIDYDVIPAGVPPGMTGNLIAVADDQASPGWGWNGTATVNPNPAPAASVVATPNVQVNSTSTPSLSGVYAFDAVTQSKILAVSLYIQVNGKFPDGQMPFPWPDASGTMHTFTSTAEFQSLASALADYATALDLGQTPTAPVTIP